MIDTHAIAVLKPERFIGKFKLFWARKRAISLVDRV
jgi:hypothetical protein